MTLHASSGSAPNIPDHTTAALPIEGGIYSVASLARYPELVQGISTRTSPGGAYWNLSARRGTHEHPPGPEAALAAREELARALGINLARVVGCQQIHGSTVAVVGASEAGRGMYPHRPSMQGADGMVTATPGLYLMVLAADCPPVFLYDPHRRAVGLAHSGWKGSAARIAYNSVEAMVDHFGSEARDIVAAIGPGIGPCCYEVGPNVVEAVEDAFLEPWSGPEPLLETRRGSTYFNMWSAIRLALLEAGVLPENISTEGVCTAHNPGAFFSHRGERGQCGLFGAVLGLRDE